MGQLHGPRTQIHEVGLCVTYIYDLNWIFGVEFKPSSLNRQHNTLPPVKLTGTTYV